MNFSFLSTAWSAVTGFVGGIQTYLIVGAVSAAVAFGAGFYVEHRLDAGTINAMKLADQQTQVQAVKKAAASQAAQDKVALDAAVAAATAQAQIVTKFVTITKEIPTYVHDTVSCPGPTVGLARVLRAAANGSDPAALQLAPGQSDDDCSDVTPSEVAGWFKSYAEASIANVQQLNDLESEVRANHQAQVAAAP